MDARKHKTGAYDTEMRTAMLDFQQKHAVIDQADIKQATLELLARQPLDNDFDALARVLTERAMQAGGFIEDGSVGSSVSDSQPYPTYLGADGARHRVPDLATASRDATMNALGIATPEDAVAFFRRHPRDDFRWLKVAVRLPPPPEYYSRAMDLSVEIDRGDVWYDFPFDAGGRAPAPAARALPAAHPVREVARRARSARALADDRRRLARRGGERRAGVLPLQGLRRRPARLAAHRHGARLDPAGFVAARRR